MAGLLSVLVVDDDDLVLRALSSLLVDDGCRVVVSSSVDDARLKLLDQRFDVLLVDWHMPVTPGVVLCSEVVRDGGPRHVLLMSGDPQLEPPKGVRMVGKLRLVSDVRTMLNTLAADVDA